MKELKDAEELTGLPLYIDDKSGESPESDCLVVAKNGFFRFTKTEDMEALLPINALPGNVGGCSSGIVWKGPKVPYEDVKFLCNVMWDVYLKKKSELGVHLWYSESTGFWYFIPRQTVSGGSTDWDTDLAGMWVKNFEFSSTNPPPDARRIGCFHSHHVMPPEWSSKDNYFQKNTENGIQLVVGWMDKGLAIRSRLVIAGIVEDVPLEDVVDFGFRKTIDIPDSLFSLDHQEKNTTSKNKDKRKSNGNTGFDDNFNVPAFALLGRLGK